jgi:hypothetical protein
MREFLFEAFFALVKGRHGHPLAGRPARALTDSL